MRILSSGDWHFNSGYDEDVLSSVNQIIERVGAGGIDLVAITGDVYDRASDPGSRNIAAECIQRIANKVPVMIVRGNHDAPGDLDILSRLDAANHIYVFNGPAQLALGPVIVHALPWLTKARWQSLHPDASKEEGDKTVSQLALDFLKSRVALSPGFLHVLVAHCTIAGARAQNHQRMGADGVVFGQYDLNEAGFYAVLAGHIHLQQGFGDNPRHFYNGSIAALDYGECPDKYYTVLDTATGEVVRIKLNTIHRQDINAAWTPTGIKIDDSVPVELLYGARVRANLRVLGGDNVDVAKQQLAKFLELDAQALEYQINPQVVPVSKVRAVEISKAVRLCDKLKECWEATGHPDESTQVDMLEKLAQLEDEGI